MAERPGGDGRAGPAGLVAQLGREAGGDAAAGILGVDGARIEAGGVVGEDGDAAVRLSLLDLADLGVEPGEVGVVGAVVRLGRPAGDHLEV